MASCTLQIGDRIAVRAEGGPFEAEYALFEAHEIELRSNNEPGTVREHGYRTTVELARERLEGDGVTPQLASAAADALGSLVAVYALGPEVRRVASLVGPAELFEGRVWRAAEKDYEGEWLDVAALALDCGAPHASRCLQLLHLASLLAQLPPATPVYLHTAEYTAGRRPGERTHRRVSLAAVLDVPAAITALAERGTARAPREKGRARTELLEAVRARLGAGILDGARAPLEAVERLLAVRERPARGPLADPELWALELQLGEGDAAAAMEKIDTLERTLGRQPGTTYLRARASLMLGTEDARQIAERASALAMSMSSFAELELLAAEAWSRAGDARRALAYARDLAENPQVDGAIRARARAIVSPPPPRPTPPPAAAIAQEGPSPSAPPSESKPMISITAGLRASGAPARSPSREMAASGGTPSRHPSAPAQAATSPAEDAPIAPTPIMSIGAPPPPPERTDSSGSIAPSATPTRPSVPAARAHPPTAPPPHATASSAPPAPIHHSPAPLPPSAPSVPPAPPAAPPTPPPPVPFTYKGGSRPPHRTEPPPSTFPAAPLLPRFEDNLVEKAESLSLPPGLHGESGAQTPSNPLEARIYFTHRTRELGRLYRARYDVELTADLRGIELAQRHLVERFPDGVLATPEDVAEVRLYGAFLSEILARRLGAEWTDVAPSEMGYWTMSVPPATTVWPIGRALRFVMMRYKERDLVSYFLEIQARARR